MKLKQMDLQSRLVEDLKQALASTIKCTGPDMDQDFLQFFNNLISVYII